MSDDDAPTAAMAPAQLARVIEAARDGSAEALGDLYADFGAIVLLTARRVTGSRDDAEDVLQDVFISLPATLAGYAERGSFAAWIRLIAARRALSLMRRGARRLQLLTNGWTRDGELRATAPADLNLDAALASLPPALRIPVVLRHFEGYSHREIAMLLDTTEGAIRMRYSRAIDRLRTLLTEDEDR